RAGPTRAGARARLRRAEAAYRARSPVVPAPRRSARARGTAPRRRGADGGRRPVFRPDATCSGRFDSRAGAARRRGGGVTKQIVWVASYPKSGNTWFRAVYDAWSTGAAVDLRELGAGLVAVRPVFDEALGIPSSALTEDEIDLLRPEVDEVLASDAEGPALYKIHDAYFPGPSGEPIVSTAATRAAVY